MPEIFNNRYDILYLQKLSSLLDFDNLVENAVQWDREANYKTYFRKGSTSAKTLTRVVKIDFCGFSSTTLLGITSKELKAEIRAVDPDNYDKIIELRVKIHQQFIFLLSKEGLKKLNDADVCLRVRFCFSYLFADFPISLMRAEDSNIWDARMDHEVSFSKNAPMTVDEWQASYIYRSQIDSLKEIGRLCIENPDLARVLDYSKAVNTFETRFAVIPIPQCLLIINNIAITDAYVYAKATRTSTTNINPLSVSCPIIVVERSTDNAFDLWRQHFLYTWLHDLTMHADMCTRFDVKNPAGLAVLIPPFVTGTKKKISQIDWQKKMGRIIQRRIELDKNRIDLDKEYDPEDADEKKRIVDWLKHVNQKMQLSTRKMPEMPTNIDSSKLSIEIGWEEDEYYVKIFYRNDTLFYMHKKKHSIAFCGVAHFAFAKQQQKEEIRPHIHETIYMKKAEFMRQIKDWLEGEDRILNTKFTKHTLFPLIINKGRGKQWSFCIAAENIKFNNVEEIRKATYKTKSGDSVSCLQF